VNDDLTIGLFAGPGGWSEGARMLGVAEVGIELDTAACATRRAAGHETIQADVAAFPVEQLAGHVTGCAGSPPCKLYSAAGTGIGRLVIDVLAAAIPRMFAGDDCRAEVRGRIFPVALEYRRTENEAREPAKRWTTERVEAAAHSDAFEASLVLEPARYIAGIGVSLRWVALEQVPAVLPLWKVYAAELRKLGYSVWAGKLNAADYGVPQTRERAILIASRVRRIWRPEPTHYDQRKGGQLWGTPWVSMAEALGWGATARPAPTATAGGTGTGGAEPFGHRDRDALTAEQEAGRWVLRQGAQQRATIRRLDDPAPTVAFGNDMAQMRWVFRNNNNNNACTRSLDEPAGTLFFGQRSNWAAWVAERPSTTVQGDPRIGRPGHKDRDKGESQFAQDSVRITVEEAAVLQSFPADYPWQGTKTKRFEQVGNAVPPLLAEHVLAMAMGISRQEMAA
jgi:DNA (cytosine-5)-methyltransferase 1